jgi:lysophospholipase L1-like esterase
MNHNGDELAGRAQASWRGRLLMCFGSVLLVCFGLEVGARLCSYSFAMQRILTVDPVMGWRLIPNARKSHLVETRYLISINSLGIRDREIDSPAGSKKRRIAVLGDSFVFGYGGVEYGRRFTELLEDTLPNTDVINFGVPSYSTDQEYLQLERIGTSVDPDVVLLCVYANDYVQCFQSYAPDIGRPKGYFSLEKSELTFHPPTLTWFYRASQASYLIGEIDRRLRITRHQYESTGREMLVPEHDRPAVFFHLLERIKHICDTRGVALKLAYIPARYERRRNVLQDLLADWSTRTYVPYLDIASTAAFEDHAARKINYFKVDQHLNELGHAQVARAMHDFLATQTDETPSRRVTP